MGTFLLVVDNKLSIKVMRGDGSVVESYHGPSEAQLKWDHEQIRCGAFCGYCFEAACKEWALWE